MKEQFVNYQTSLRLKNLGFDEPCMAYYYDAGNGIELFPISQNDSYSLFRSEKNNDYDSEEDCSSPLYQQVTTWLREKHSIEVEVGVLYGKNGYDFCIATSSNYLEFDNSKYKWAYQEALKAGIGKALNILENGNNN